MEDNISKEKIQGATSAQEKPEAAKLSLEKLNTTCNTLLQSVVNQYYDITRLQMLLDHVFETHKEVLNYPTAEVIEKIDAQALADARKTYAEFFVDKG